MAEIKCTYVIDWCRTAFRNIDEKDTIVRILWHKKIFLQAGV
jgi:hypothetical protein